METLHSSILKILKRAPLIKLKSILKYKLNQKDVSITDEELDLWVDRLLSGVEGAFTIEGDALIREIIIDITSNDIEEIEKSVNKFMKSGVSDVIDVATNNFAAKKLKIIKKHWQHGRRSERIEAFEFRENLDARWGRAIDRLRLLLDLTREFGGSFHEKFSRSRTVKRKSLNEILIILHARACRVSAEIIVLLESGLADGAMARWRTLHETGVITGIIHQFGEEIAVKYTDHQYVESKKALEEYKKSSVVLGYRDLSRRDIAAVDKAYAGVIEKYGKEFGSEYGWASEHLGIKKPNFRDLERVAGEAAMRSHYKMASYGVHAGAKGIFFNIAHPLDGVMLASYSNVGLEEPGQNAANTLVKINSCLFGPRWKADDIADMKVMVALRDEIIDAFMKAARQLDRDIRSM